MDYEQQPKKTNWLMWGLLIGGVLVALPIACCAGVGLLGFNAIKAPFDATVTTLEGDERVTSVIGTPITYENVMITDFKNENGNGHASIDTNFIGPNGKAHVKGKMNVSAHEWSPDNLTVKFDDGTEITIP